MDKISSLRAALVAANPEFAEGRSPERLKCYVDQGRLVSRRTGNLGFQYRYTVRLFFEGYTRGPDLIMVPLLLWLRTHQPDLLLRYATEDDNIRFAADILDDKSWDIAITFELQETVTVVPRQDGSGWDVVHVPEPSPDDPLMHPSLDTPDGPVLLQQLFFGGERILPREDEE
jgi:hypothetical protein